MGRRLRSSDHIKRWSVTFNSDHHHYRQFSRYKDGNMRDNQREFEQFDWLTWLLPSNYM